MAAQGWLPTLDSVAQDVRYGVRTLARNPAFSAVAVLVLALGTGVTTALFSIVYAVYFRPLPVQSPDELVYIYARITSGRFPAHAISTRVYDRIAADGRAFVALTAHSRGGGIMTIDGSDESLAGELVLGNYFDVLGVRAQLGRTLTPREDDPANPDRAIVLSHAFWQRRFKSDPNIIGRAVLLAERTFTIVGVIEPGFKGLSDPWNPIDFWVTLAQRQENVPALRRGQFSVFPIARLRPGVTLDQARAIVASHDEELQRGYAPSARVRHLLLPASAVRMPFAPEGKIVSARMAGALLALIAVVLAIAAANVAGILMARGVGRRGEIGVRMAIGAAGTRVMRQLLTESLLLAVAGGLAGWFVSWALLELFRASTPAQFAMDAPMDVRVFFFTAGVCALVGLVVGIGPALQASRVDVLSALGGGTMAITRRTRLRFRYGIVVPQVALSLVLLLVAGVYLKDLLRIERTNLGFSTRGSIVVRYWLQGPTPGLAPTTDQRMLEERHAERTRNFYRNVTQRFETMPQLSMASLSDGVPTNYGSWRAWSVMTNDGGAASRATDRAFISPRYFDVMGMRVLRGRPFDERDTTTSPKVAILSAQLAQALWPDGNALGRSVALTGVGTTPKPDEWREVVGIVNDVAPVLQDLGDNPYIYMPMSQEWRVFGYTAIARPSSDQAAAIDAVISAIKGADLGVRITGVRTMEQAVGDILYPRRLAAAILTACSAIGLLLACIGLYGVVAYSMAQRQKEIGIRAALGAETRDIVRLVIGEGLAVLAAGSVIGFALSMLALPLVSNLVIPVPGPNALLLIGVPMLLGLIVLLACSLPARRASKVNPVDVLRAL